MAWRRLTTILALSLVAALAVAPGALAEESPPNCWEATDKDAEPTNGPYYVDVEGVTVEVWEETNDLPGLQKESCDAAGTIVPADTHVVTVDEAEDARDVLDELPEVPTLPCVPTPGFYLCVF